LVDPEDNRYFLIVLWLNTDFSIVLDVMATAAPAPAPAPGHAPAPYEFLEEALNGNHYLGTQEGETLTRGQINVYQFAGLIGGATRPLEEVPIDGRQAMRFIRINATHIAQASREDPQRIQDQEAICLAYLRLLAVREGLVSPHFSPAAFNVDYSEWDDFEWRDAQITVTEEAVRNTLRADVVRVLTETFTDRVCLVAFVFRSRGHHYMNDYEEIYQRVWDKCRYGNDMRLVSFRAMATVAFHAIFPQILEEFWARSVAEFRCNGALAKRFDVAAAGTAGPNVVYQGVKDLQMVAPGLHDRISEAIEYLEQTMAALRSHRYAGSVNARYYGAARVVFDERRVAAIAATIKAALDNLADDAPLARSPALQRIASGAPITGAVFGRAIGKIADRSETVDSLVRAPVST